MSNRQVPHVYRTIMNDVVENVRPEFDELGVEEAVLNELLRSWESKVAQSRVADFTTDLRMAPVAVQFPMLPNPLPGTTAAAAAPPSAAGSSKAGSSAGDPKPKKEEEAGATPTAKKEGAAGGDDEDEINSDLDDPEDELDNEDDEGGAADGDIIIALYEKVQRVKNKWKVTLKDGLVSVNGKDYLFGKLAGEFEW